MVREKRRLSEKRRISALLGKRHCVSARRRLSSRSARPLTSDIEGEVPQKEKSKGEHGFSEKGQRGAREAPSKSEAPFTSIFLRGASPSEKGTSRGNRHPWHFSPGEAAQVGTSREKRLGMALLPARSARFSALLPRGDGPRWGEGREERQERRSASWGAMREAGRYARHTMTI
jgi:hypothetical protein